VKRVYKPNLVPAETGDDHSSRPAVTCRLKQPTRKRRRITSTLSGQLNHVSLFGLAPRGVCLAEGCYQPSPVSSYLTVSPITLSGWSVLCCTCRHIFSNVPGRYPARCPVVFGLSSSACGRSDHPTRFTNKAGKV